MKKRLAFNKKGVKFHTMNEKNITLNDSLGFTPYMKDVQDQPYAVDRLLTLASSVSSLAPLSELLGATRVIISGMGSSHFTTYPIYKALIKAGVPTWRIDSAQLLDLLPEIVIPGTVLWLTSQSGESGEIIQIIECISKEIHIVGVTNNVNSTLANRANTLIELNSGEEATVSTKSYLNSILVARIVESEIAQNRSAVMTDLAGTGKEISRFLDDLEKSIHAFSKFGDGKQLLLLGRGDSAISAQAAALILKESAKIPAEGMSAGVFRHGPIELSNHQTSVIIFNHDGESESELNAALASELIRNEVEVAWIGNQNFAPTGVLNFITPRFLDPLIGDALAFQTMSFAFAQRKGIEAGKFLVAQKVTQKL